MTIVAQHLTLADLVYQSPKGLLDVVGYCEGLLPIIFMVECQHFCWPLMMPSSVVAPKAAAAFLILVEPMPPPMSTPP